VGVAVLRGPLVLGPAIGTRNGCLDRRTSLGSITSLESGSSCRGELHAPMEPMNCTLMPVCSNRLPSFGLIVTAPLTDSPSMYRGTRSRRLLSSLTSTVWRLSRSSRTMSISTGVEKKRDAIVCSTEMLRGRMSSMIQNVASPLSHPPQAALSASCFVFLFTFCLSTTCSVNERICLKERS